eukprot:6193998-Pleurochrysis_carterae.AAC.1
MSRVDVHVIRRSEGEAVSDLLCWECPLRTKARTSTATATRTRVLSTDPVDDSVLSLRKVDAETTSPRTIKLYACHKSSGSSGRIFASPEPAPFELNASPVVPSSRIESDASPSAS